jgi:hypothetical protein
MPYVINNLRIKPSKSAKLTTKCIFFRMKNVLFAKCDCTPSETPVTQAQTPELAHSNFVFI